MTEQTAVFPISDGEQYGLTKREYFAGLAMQGMVAGQHGEWTDVGLTLESELAIVNQSRRLADALIAELAKEVKE